MKTVSEMWHKAWPDDGAFVRASAQDLERLVELVRKDYSFTHAQMWLRRFDDAVKAEREACAKLVETLHETSWPDSIAAAIRARNNT